MKKIACTAFALGILILSRIGIAGDETFLSLESAVETALRDNPGLAEMEARARAMVAIPSQAGSLPDPSLSLNALNLPTDSFDFDQEPMTQMQVGISQALPFPGKLSLKERASGFDAAAAGADVGETRLRLIRDVKKRWWTFTANLRWRLTC